MRDWWAGFAESQAGRFALFLPVSAMAGDAVYFAWRVEPPVWLGIALLGLGMGLAGMRRWLLAYGAGLAVAFFALGLLSAQWASGRAAPFAALPGRAVVLDGRVVSAEALPAGARVVLDRVRIGGMSIGRRLVRLSLDADPGLAAGAFVAMRAMVAPPAPPAYPGGRDLQREDYFNGLGGYGYGLGAVTLLRAAPARCGARLRGRIAARVTAVLPGAEGAVATTLLTGYSAAIPASDRAAFRDAGLSHLLAIAGLHVGIVMGLVAAALRWGLLRSERVALYWPVRSVVAVGGLAGGLGYVLLTGAHVPTLRSFAMAALVVLAVLVGRRGVSLRGWGLAALGVVAVAPAAILGPSFQLSFAAVLALIAGYEALGRGLSWLRGDGGGWRWLAHQVAALALTSLLAGGACLPFVAYPFGVVQPYFVLANLVAVPLAALWIMPAGLVALGLMPFGLERLALPPMGWGIGLVLRLAHWVAALPGASIAVPHVPMASLLLFAAGLAWLCLWRLRVRLLGLVAMAACVVPALVARVPDVLIAANSRLVGIVAPGALYVQAAHGGDDYVQAAWVQYLGRAAMDLAGDPAARCAGAACRIVTGRGEVQIGLHTRVCGAAAMIMVSGELPYCAGALGVDRSFTFRNGAVALWLGGGGRLLSDRDVRGRRPWVFLPPEQRRAGLDLPMARTEALP